MNIMEIALHDHLVNTQNVKALYDGEVARIFAKIVADHSQKNQDDEEPMAGWVPECPILGRPCERYAKEDFDDEI